jgi:hypothetical protein
MSDVVYVTTYDEPDFTSEFCNVEYSFKQGETTALPMNAARHIFGYGDDNKMPYLTRLGWVRLNTEYNKGLERLAKIQFSAEPPSKGRSLPSAVGVVPLLVEKRAGGKSNPRAA